MHHGKSSSRVCFADGLELMVSCQFFGLQLDRGNLSNALADDLLGDLGLTTDDYNNVCQPFSVYRALLTLDTGHHYSACLFSCCRVPRAVSYQALWLQEYFACGMLLLLILADPYLC